jgi:uncharacterized protein (DUF58 family)
MSDTSTLITPTLFHEARRIELRMRRSITASLVGRYRSAFRGSGLTFADLREYSPGDDVKSIHWKVTARTGRTYVKSFEEERQLSVLVAVDVSASTSAGTHTSRYRKETEFAAIIAMLAHRAQDQIGTCLFSNEVVHYLPPKPSNVQFHRVLAALLRPPPAPKETDIASVVKHLSEYLTRPALVFLISDFYAPPFDDALALLARRHDVICTVVEDALDAKIPNAGLVTFRDPESGETLMVDTSSARVRAALEARHAQRISDLEARCRHVDASLLRLNEQPLAALSRFMHHREGSRGRRR